MLSGSSLELDSADVSRLRTCDVNENFRTCSIINGARGGREEAQITQTW